MKLLLFLLSIYLCFCFRIPFYKSKFHINKLQSNSPKLWDVLSINLKDNARNWFIRRAEQSGVDWNAITFRYQEELNQLENIYKMKNNQSMIYPLYYTRPFHGYDDGNLNWLAALEGEAATLSMAVNYWKNNDPVTTEKWLRNNITQNIQHYINQEATNKPLSILDVGSSIGISTEYLYKTIPECRKIYGLDLSPYFVSLATFRAQQEKLPITYVHQNAETPKFNQKFDLIVCNFILHEIPKVPTDKILKELTALLNENGVLAVVDLDPTKIRDNLIVNTFRKWAFEVTEPHIYEYYQTNMTLLMSHHLQNIVKISNDPINSIWIGKNSI